MKKTSKKDVLLLIGLLGVLVAVAGYFLAYKPNTEKTEKLKAENEQLQQRVIDLGNKMKNKSTYIEETESMNNEMQAIYQLFPVDTREEDSILLAINQELLAPMKVESVAINTLEEVPFLDDVQEEEEVEYTYEIGEVETYEDQEGIQEPETVETAPQDETASVGNPYGLFNRETTINYIVTYEGLKRGIKNICVQPNRMSIEKVTVAFDETTGLLAGSTVVNMYCVPGQEGKEYVEPDFSSVLLGTDNIFGTVKIYSEENLPDLEGTEASEAAE